MNLRAGWPPTSETAPRRPPSEATAEIPLARGRRRLRTHMSSEYDVELFASDGMSAQPDHLNHPLPLGKFRKRDRDRPRRPPDHARGPLRKPNRALPASSSTPTMTRRPPFTCAAHAVAPIAGGGCGARREQSARPTTKGPPSRSPIGPSSPVVRSSQSRRPISGDSKEQRKSPRA